MAMRPCLISVGRWSSRPASAGSLGPLGSKGPRLTAASPAGSQKHASGTSARPYESESLGPSG
eukprot:12567177-Heterocapsa_arctica.AAC.1